MHMSGHLNSDVITFDDVTLRCFYVTSRHLIYRGHFWYNDIDTKDKSTKVRPLGAGEVLSISIVHRGTMIIDTVRSTSERSLRVEERCSIVCCIVNSLLA